MVCNLLKAGASVVAYDPSQAALKAAEQAGAVPAATAADVARRAAVVLTALPDDRVLRAVVADLLPALPEGSVHVSCSTVSPKTSRELAEEHSARKVGFVAAPVFARPDGMRRGEATIPVSGTSWAKDLAKPILQHTSLEVHDFGNDAGAANVVKLGGNFLIAAAIESLAEAAALAESHGVDREQFVSLMSSTIFDCLIYKGYGHRVATRDHFPHPDAHFALDLGSKDVSLIHAAAMDAKCPMPVASLLRDRYIASQNAGRGKFDWSALGLRASEDAGVDVTSTVKTLLASTEKL
jgi:3-hydroxyisobutyrate dehydrogenase-like beta-hydroxyacid dehydrogenase